MSEQGLVRRPAITRSVLRWAERCLWLAALLALGYWLFVFLEARIYQAGESRRLNRALQEDLSAQRDARAPSAPAAVPSQALPETGALIGRLEIPRLGFRAMVVEGSDDRTLQLAVGHLRGAALPGEPGNVVLAAHRDTFFRPLRNIREGDRIAVTTPRGRLEYRVESTAVVDPDDTQVLQASLQPTLTLVTCYPFSYVGAAPKRFVVQAREVSGRWPPAAEPPPTRLEYAASRATRPQSQRAAAVAPSVDQREIDPATATLDSASSPQTSAVETSGETSTDESVTRPHRGIKRIPGRVFGKLAGVLRRRGKHGDEAVGAIGASDF